MEDKLIGYAENISLFFHQHPINCDITDYVFKNKINGNVAGRVTINNKIYNVDFSFRNITDTFYHLYYYKLNFFLYNKTHNTEYDGIVYIVESNTTYLLKYNTNDYTMYRGFLDYNIKNRTIRPGHQCLYCSVKNCKPRLLNDLNRI